MTEQEVVALLRRLLNDANPRPLRGGELSVLVKASFPGFNPIAFASRNLRDFIRKNLSDEISEVGKSGADILYGLRERQHELFKLTPPPVEAPPPPTSDQRASLSQLLTNPRIWKTFASPETPYRLYVVPSSGVVRVVKPNESPDPSWHEIRPISGEVLLQIAKDFIAEVPEPQRGTLLITLDQPRWWFPYFDLLRTFGLKWRWVLYRRRRIADEFERALQKLPSMPSQPREALEAEQRPLAATSSQQPASLMRRIASEAVQRMTDSELRALNLPLGYVVDSLTTR